MPRKCKHYKTVSTEDTRKNFEMLLGEKIKRTKWDVPYAEISGCTVPWGLAKTYDSEKDCHGDKSKCTILKQKKQ